MQALFISPHYIPSVSSRFKSPISLFSLSMVSSSSSSETMKRYSVIADAASWYCAVALLALILIGSIRTNSASEERVRGSQLLNRPCDEIYVVGEGETLHTISDKCGDPYIVERNPHIHDPDDVFPGLIIKIIPSTGRKL